MTRIAGLLLGALVLIGHMFGDTPGRPAVRDVDGHTYESVTIGSQVWLAASLWVTRGPDGQPLPSFAPNGDARQVEAYGRLYSWRAAQQACPKGWHLPSDAEWTALESSLGSQAGVRLKDPDHWPNSPELAAASRPGFKARPAGYWNDQGFETFFGSRAVFWTSTAQDEHFVWSRVLSAGSGGLRRAPQHPQYGFSVRCVRNG